MSSSGNDCYFYYYSRCAKGERCCFRHSEPALGTELVCKAWQNNRCVRANCPYRHMVIDNPRIQTPCYWENQPSGCLKKHCLFKHSKPRDEKMSYMDYNPPKINRSLKRVHPVESHGQSPGSTEGPQGSPLVDNSAGVQKNANSRSAVADADAACSGAEENGSGDDDSADSNEITVTVGATIDRFHELEERFGSFSRSPPRKSRLTIRHNADFPPQTPGD
uniref:C3H1-type domain-containing protein n=1 Tax=Trichuris muris TaxID=70415 RepID=A0A5S6Q075_TRIMR